MSNSNALGVRANVVSHRSFETMGIPILRGRPFNLSDGPGTARVTVVTKSLADRLWPNEEPTGKTIRDDRQQFLQVVGVGPDTVYTSTVEPERQPTSYLLQPASIVSLLLGQGVRLLGIGAAIDLTGALVGTRYIEAQLFGVTATDPVTFVGG